MFTRFRDHTNLEGTHAVFGASQSSWLRYDDETLVLTYKKRRASELGTKLHAWAKETIDLGIKQPRSNKALYAYVNDAIAFGMSTEVVLYYSDHFYGTADSICFRNNMLRIHDLKTGEIPIKSIDQVMVYAALFCLEYDVDPRNINTELRIYQFKEPIVFNPVPEDILGVMNHIVHCEKILNKIDEKGV